ncbi:hypothetical protein BBP40_011115 [Aspergillus hancockii]|nr:hypothetical protein BBP40_011115 [Aspergillus hancockii]
MAIFLAAGVTANQAAGKFQVLFFYQLCRLEVDVHGLANSRMAPGCAKSGVVCDMEAFIKEVCNSTLKPERDRDGEIIREPSGKPNLLKDPDFDKIGWAHIGEGADPNVFSTEFGKSGFKGLMDNAKIFKRWDQKDNFETEPADDRFNKITAALKTHTDARRYDQAQKITEKFESEMEKKGFSVTYTDPIERPPVPGYKKIDTDQTISNNKAKAGFDKVEQWVRDYVT